MFEYNVVFSKRRTLSLTIKYDNQITVRCPYHTSQREIERFVNSKKTWLEKHIAKNIRSRRNNAELLAYKKVLVGGEARVLIIGDENCVTDGEIRVKNIKYLKTLFIKSFASEFLELFNSICLRTGLNAKSVKFRDYKSRWGCCDSKCNVIFNYKLLMLPRDLQIYVIVHELCHTKHHDHSSAFWARVEDVLGDYRQSDRLLKEYAFLIRLY